ncbi:MAG: carboxypeptidase regulatory-like domain-containing protein [Pseudomonadota bacterium]
MRAHLLLATALVTGCGGPVGLPVAVAPDDTGEAPPARHGALGGVVLDAAGQPIAGAHLITVPRGHEAESAADGSFLLSWLPPDDYALSVSAAGFETERTDDVEVLAGAQATLDVQLEPAPAGGLLRVEVYGPHAQHLEGAIVSVSNGASGTTGADGLAWVGGAAGEDLTITVQDSASALWPVERGGVDIPAAGGLQWTVRLAGRPTAAATWSGSTICTYCHGDQADAHAAGAHARAQAQAPSSELLAVFTAGASVAIGAASATLWLDGADPAVTLTDSSGASLAFTVTSYVGDPARRTVPLVAVGAQHQPMPFAWIAEASARVGYPDSQARLVPYEIQRWFAADSTFAFGGDGPDPSLGAEAGCLPCHSSGYTFTRRADGGADLTYASSAAAATGVGCEACHGMGSEHASSANVERITNPAVLTPERAQEACGQCHGRTTGLASGLPHPHGEDTRFLPGDVLARFADSTGAAWPVGAAADTRMQLDEHRLSPHGGQGAELACTACHAVHDPAGGGEAALLQLPSVDNALCEACHLASSFGGDPAEALAHTGHHLDQPEGLLEGARCTGCHMPPTASDGVWSDESGAGMLASHLIFPISPAETLAAFDAAGVDELEPGQFTPHACLDCHGWDAWYFDDVGVTFPGPHGDPRLRSTHEAYLAAWEELVP